MALARWQATIVNEKGDVVSGAQVTVRREIAGAPLANLFSDRDGLVPIGNPITVGTDGFAAFHVTGGAYRIDAVASGFTRTWRYVGIGLQSESDAILLDISYVFDDATADADPGVGEFRFNNATLASVTKIFLSETDDFGATVSSWIGRMDDYGSSADRGVIVVRALDGSAEFIGQVTGTIADDGNYRDITVTHLASTGTFVSGVRVGIQFVPRGVDGSVTAAGTLTDNYLVTGDGSGVVKATTETYTGNLDSLAGSDLGTSLYRVATGASNGPSGATVNGSHVMTFTWDSASARQIFYEFNSGLQRIWTREKISSAWGSWGVVGGGKQTIWVPATAMKLKAGPAFIAYAAGALAIDVIAFDPSAAEDACFTIAMPKGWNQGNLSYRVYWKHAATTTNFAVMWELFADSYGNDDAMDGGSYTSLTTVTDTGGTTDDVYISDESTPTTVANTGTIDLINFVVRRNASNGADTLAVDAQLIGVMVHYLAASNTDE